jgi:hypothetical protein
VAASDLTALVALAAVSAMLRTLTAWQGKL